MADEKAPIPASSSHRLPTVSASQALHRSHAHGARTVSTGISQLNKLLCSPSLPGHDVSGGYPRGKITELYGPPGSGKTTFGIQAAINALREGHQVVWIDAACARLVPHRFQNIFSAPQNPSDPSPDELEKHFRYLPVPRLAHLLALFVHPPASFPPPGTSLIIIDSLSTLIDNEYPRNADDRNSKGKSEQSRWAAGRRFAVINDLISTFSKFAALHDIALLVTCQTITRIRGASRALLVPAISGVEWQAGISTRLVLFRDWTRKDQASVAADSDRLQNARFVGLVKVNGTVLADEGGVGTVVPFKIDNNGLCDAPIILDEPGRVAFLPAHTGAMKRSFADMKEADEPNSDELYGWIEDDEVAAEGLLIDEAQITDDIDVTTSLHINDVT